MPVAASESLEIYLYSCAFLPCHKQNCLEPRARGLSVYGLGSRITMAERAFVVEAFARAGGRAIVAHADIAALSGPGDPPADHRVYGALLNHAVEKWLPESGGAIDVTIDDGRYDALRNIAMRDAVQKSVGQWGRARLADSRRCAGVQFADVIANSHFHVALATREVARIDALLQPLWQADIIRRLPVTAI